MTVDVMVLRKVTSKVNINVNKKRAEERALDAPLIEIWQRSES